MAKNTESINQSLFDLLRSRGYGPTMLDTSGKEIPVPEDAEVFQFQFVKDGKEYGTVTLSVDGLHKLVVYFGDDVANSEKETGSTGSESWYQLLNHLKRFSQQHQLSFELKNTNHLKYDMAKRDHMKKQEKIAEGYHPMGKKASYNDNTPTVKMVIQHNREIQEGEQRYRNVARIFLENQLGERILAPTVKPGIASIYARHLAEGGLPHDDRWNHINSLCEEYQKMAGFVRATRNGQFNESAQRLVNEGINHYNQLRESLSKMRGHRGYNSYFESYTPPLMEDDSEATNLNELFVQETLDPRIESVMPILNKLHKKVAEMKEVDALSEWADSLIEGDGGQEALNPIGIPESVGGGIDAILAQHPEAVENFKQGGDMDYDLQSDLWDYYFSQGDIKNYDADASEYIGQQLADYLGIDEGLAGAALGGIAGAALTKSSQGAMTGASIGSEIQDTLTKEDVKEGIADDYEDMADRELIRHARMLGLEDNIVMDGEGGLANRREIIRLLQQEAEGDLEEGLDANQKRVGQLGPTEKVKNNNIGKLVGANENFINTVDQAVVSEMDKSQTPPGRDGSSGDSDAGKKEHYGKMVKPGDVVKKGVKALDKAMDKEHKKDVKEGQEDLDAILRIIRK